MNNSTHFINENLMFPTLIIGLVLLLVFVWKEWKGYFNGSFFLKTVISFIALVALAMMVLQPTVQKESNKKAILLTKGYDQTKMDSLKKNIPEIKIIKYQNGKSVKRELDSVGEVFILGDGIPYFDFWQVNNHPVTYIKSELPKGIIKLKYNQEIVQGDELKFLGLYHKPNSGNRLVLQDSGGAGLDSILLDNEGQNGFELTTTSKIPGKFLFQLVEKDSLGKSITEQPLPVVINDKTHLKILIVNEFPSFETKYIKNFLAEAGHELVVRSQITKRKYKFEYFNTDKKPLYGFTSENLEDFDLLVLDVDSYFKLSKKSKETILNSSREKGLGVFVQPDERLFKKSKLFKGTTISLDVNKTTLLKSWPKLRLEKYPFRILNSSSLNGLSIDNHTFYEYNGLGRFGTTFLKDTYQLVLDGKSNEYRQIWSQIIERLSRKKGQIIKLKSPQMFAFQNQPFSVELYTALEKPMIIHESGYGIPLIQDIANGDLWKAKTYPNELGWSSLKTKSVSAMTHHYYVMDTLRWRSLVSAKTISDNQRNFRETNNSLDKIKIRQPLPSVWFFLCFVIAMGLLWLIPKISK